MSDLLLCRDGRRIRPGASVGRCDFGYRIAVRRRYRPAGRRVQHVQLSGHRKYEEPIVVQDRTDGHAGVPRLVRPLPAPGPFAASCLERMHGLIGAPYADAIAFSGGVRGKYAERYAQGTNLVRLDPDVAKVFPDSTAVNDALRALVKIIQERSSAT